MVRSTTAMTLVQLVWRKADYHKLFQLNCSAERSTPATERISGAVLNRVGFAERSEAALRGFHRREYASFLLDQVVFNPPCLFGSLEELLPWGHTFAEKHPVSLSLFGGPIFTVHGHDAAGIGFDPGNRIRSGLDTGADVELQHHIFGGVGGEHFDGT